MRERVRAKFWNWGYGSLLTRWLRPCSRMAVSHAWQNYVQFILLSIPNQCKMWNVKEKTEKYTKFGHLKFCAGFSIFPTFCCIQLKTNLFLYVSLRILCSEFRGGEWILSFRLMFNLPGCFQKAQDAVIVLIPGTTVEWISGWTVAGTLGSALGANIVRWFPVVVGEAP